SDLIRRDTDPDRPSPAAPAPRYDPHLCEGRSRQPAHAHPAMARSWTMSALGDALDRYAGMRRAFGYKFAAPERLLRDFVGFMDAQAEAVITSKLGVDWATGTAGPASWPSRLAAVRGFARHVACAEPLTQVPPIGILRQPRRRTPYIYTVQEIGALMDAVLTLPPAKGLRRWTYHYMFGLLAVTGLRIGEALRLKRDDVDFGAGILTIHDTRVQTQLAS